jgi:formyltetrahydrofolate synthetase
MGAEKFFDIKCRASGLARRRGRRRHVRALKMHGGVGRIVAGKPLDPALTERTSRRSGRGVEPREADRERPDVRRAGGRGDQQLPDGHAGRGGGDRDGRARGRRPRGSRRDAFRRRRDGAADLRRAVWDAASSGEADFRLLYRDDAPLGEKILTIATRGLRADGIELTPTAKRALKLYEDLGMGNLPVCMAKTQYSLSHDANLKGRPSGFTVPIRDIRLSAGAGFITPLVGEMRTMPGLPSRPGGENIDIDGDGNIVGLF